MFFLFVSRPIPKSCKRLSSRRQEHLDDFTDDLGLQIDPEMIEQEMDVGDVKLELDDEGNIIDSKSKPEESEIVISDSEEESEESFFHCPFCSFKSPSQLKMGEHVIANHEKPKVEANSKRARSNKLFSCQICSKKYQTTVTLEQHYKKDHPHVILIRQGKSK